MKKDLETLQKENRMREMRLDESIQGLANIDQENETITNSHVIAAKPKQPNILSMLRNDEKFKYELR